MNKNNLRRIAVFMAIVAASPQMKTLALQLKYGGPGFWEKKPVVIKHRSDNKEFYKNPKIMVPAVAGGTTLLISTILLSLWGAGVIGKKEKSDEKVNVNITGNIQGENKKSPFQDYWKVVEKIESGDVYDFCTGETKYDSYNDSFNSSYNGINNDNPQKLTICKKLAEDLKQYASQFEQVLYYKKWNLRIDANNGRLHICIYYNTAKKQYEFKVCSSNDQKTYKFNVKKI